MCESYGGTGMSKILIVEDDVAINGLLAEILHKENYETVQAYSGTEARLLIDGGSGSTLSLIIMDLMLPGMMGEELLPLIKQQVDIPVLVLSAKDTTQDKTGLLRAGADDYMTKPFAEEELLARIEVLLRRGGTVVKDNDLEYQDITLELEGRKVTKAGKTLSLTAREFDILALLLQNPQKVFTKSNLYQSVWRDEFFGDDNTVNVHISNLRNKLGKGEYIQTVWGIGFKLYDLSKS